jgi:hypothetical protein
MCSIHPGTHLQRRMSNILCNNITNINMFNLYQKQNSPKPI